MPDTTIICPKCGATIPLTEAISRQIREELTADFNKKLSEQSAALAAREEKLVADQSALEQRRAELEVSVQRLLESERQKLRDVAIKEATDLLKIQMADLENRLENEKRRREEAEKQELDIRKKQVQLEEAREKMELELARRMQEERAKINQLALEKAAEAERLKLEEKEKIITDLQREISALKQRAEQGSMQLQGETLEITLEKDLRNAFVSDLIEEVKKGQRGADIRQTVRLKDSTVCGIILWESKRAKNWSSEWPEKLREDQRQTQAELAVLVTTCLPDGVRGIGQVEGVWVCDWPLALGLAAALRQVLIAARLAKIQQAGWVEKAQSVYDYLCGTEFRQRIEAIVEAFLSLKSQLEAEKLAFARQWKEREKQLEKALTQTAMIYGSLQGITDRQALPTIEVLELPGNTAE